jgi:cyclohexa-1,5-dienecarbonyl-CoA hydratase
MGLGLSEIKEGEMKLKSNLIISKCSSDTGTITLNQPPNILTTDMMNQISQALHEYSTMGNLKVIVFRAEGKNFSFGVDVKEHLGASMDPMLKSFNRMMEILHNINILTVAVTQGGCLGGGWELVLGCDLCIARNDSYFGFPEVKLGVFPPIGIFQLSRLIGEPLAKQFICSGKSIDVTLAKSLGLLNLIVTPDSIEEKVDEFLGQFLDKSAETLRMTNLTFRNIQKIPDFGHATQEADRLYRILMTKKDPEEGMNAYLERRKPRWKNC